MASTADVGLVIITGLSGAGKTQVIRNLEDLGFFCVDNLPPNLIGKFTELCLHSEGRIKRLAAVVDIRGREFFGALEGALEEVAAAGAAYRIVFLEADDETLVRRYKESRRRHPLAPQGRVLEGIRAERHRMEELRGRAHLIIDTSDLTPGQLRERIRDQFGGEDALPPLVVTVLSFGFKHGLPLDADLVLDVRFLPNPNYVPSLKDLDGNAPAVREYVLRWPVTQGFLHRTEDFLRFLLPHYVREGKGQLTVAVGCTGGQHRSVVIADQLAGFLRREGDSVLLYHRDLPKSQAEES